jgi:hypothetical protein
VTVLRVSEKHGLEEICARVENAAHTMLETFCEQVDLEKLEEARQVAEDYKWNDLLTLMKGTTELTKMMKAIQVAAADENIAVLRAIVQRARLEKRERVLEVADRHLREVASRVGDRMGLPAEWDVVMELAGKGEKKLLKKSEENQEDLLRVIQKLVDDTFTGWGGLGKQTRTRDRATEAIAKRLKVKSVVYVQNAENYVNYKARRTVIAQECPAGMKTDWDVKTGTFDLSGIGRYTKHPTDPSIGEHYLWHGTSPAGAMGITDVDFDLRRAGKSFGALFGNGIYFAESSMKSDEYTRPDKRGWHPFILCRVVLGNISYCDAMDPTVVKAQLEAMCKPGGPGFHSVLGDREKVRKTFREFIVYNTHQVYPEYIVWYEREM